MKYYAVAIGKKPGIYTTWEECSRYVTGYKGARFKSFSTKEEAEKYYGYFHGNALPKDKQYSTAVPIKYKNIDNCVLCGKTFKQLLGKNNERRNSPCCPSCKKERYRVKSEVYKATRCQIKGLSINELVYLKKILRVDNIFEHLRKHPWDAMKKQDAGRVAALLKMLS